MERMFEEMKTIMEIDVNAFWTSIATIISALLPLVWKTAVNIKKKISNDIIWKSKKIYENDFFYVYVLIYALIVGVLIGIIFIILRVIMDDRLLLAILFLLLLKAIAFINNRKSVRIRLLEMSPFMGKILIDAPIIIITIDICYSITNKEKQIFENVCFLLFLLCEIIGMVIFQGRYEKYENSYADIILSTSEKIEKIEIDKIQKKGKWLVIKKETEKKLVLFESINRIDYYGEPKYIMKENIFYVLWNVMSQWILGR